MFKAYLYKNGQPIKTDLSVEDIKQALSDEHSILWVDIAQSEDADIDLMTNVFNLHPLTIEDCIMPNARPKVEKFDNYLFLNTFALEVRPEEEEEIKTVELDFCLGKNFLLTVHADKIKSVTATQEKIEKKSPLMDKGADFLLCTVIDTMVDNYFPVINMFDDRVDDISDELFQDPNQETLNKIYNLKNEIMLLRRTVGPQTDTVNMIIRGSFSFISESNITYFRNVYDNLGRLGDTIGNSRDIITSALETYNSVVSNRLNETMKTLTVIATIVMPLTLVASIYGMNFKYMPELNSKFGYPIVMGLMVALSAGMLYYFKRKKWL